MAVNFFPRMNSEAVSGKSRNKKENCKVAH